MISGATIGDIIQDVIGIEGAYSNDPGDAGGETIYGISRRWFPEAWENGPPSLDAAVAIYIDEFWKPLRCDALDSISVAAELFEAGVNLGPRDAVLIAQRAYNAIAPESWEVLTDDGWIGPATIRALNRMSAQYEVALFNAMNVLQGWEYLFAKNDPAFVRGWIAKRIRSIRPGEQLQGGS